MLSDSPVLDARVVERISRSKGEPHWMTRMRLDGLRWFERMSPADRSAADLPDIVSRHIASLRPEAQLVHHEDRDDLSHQGIVFVDMEAALRQYPHLVREHVGTVIPPADGMFAALNASLWSGGTFIYAPPGAECEVPLQVDSQGDSRHPGRFERTLIIADEGAQVHYVEGCSAPVYIGDPWHSAVIEIIVKPSARVSCTTIQNWSPNVHHVVTKRARVEAHGHVELVDGDIGSKRTTNLSSVHLVGEWATGEVRSLAAAGGGQHRNSAAVVVHAAPDTTSTIVSKSIGGGGGIATQRGLVRVEAGARRCRSHIECDALLLDGDSVCDPLPQTEVGEIDARIVHAATASRITDEQIFYLMSRGLTEERAIGLVAGGFIEPITGSLRTEHAVELTRMIEFQLSGSTG